MTVDSAGNVFVADAWNNTIRMVTRAGVVTTIGGTPGLVGEADGVGRAAGFANPSGITVDSAGTLLVADADNNRLSQGTLVYRRRSSSSRRRHERPETAGTIVVTVTLDGPSPNPSRLDYATSMTPRQAQTWRATAGADYTATRGTLTFAPGETSSRDHDPDPRRRRSRARRNGADLTFLNPVNAAFPAGAA